EPSLSAFVLLRAPRRPPSPPPSPYTTLFRSHDAEFDEPQPSTARPRDARFDQRAGDARAAPVGPYVDAPNHRAVPHFEMVVAVEDRKSTRLNSSHEWISYAVFCLKKKSTTFS